MIFLCDVVDRCYSCNEDTISSDVHKSGLAIKAQAQMIHTVSLAQVPRITIVVGDSFGPTSFAMVRCIPYLRVVLMHLPKYRLKLLLHVSKSILAIIYE